MELPFANGVLCVQTEEVGVGQPAEPTLCCLQISENSLASIGTLFLFFQDLLPASATPWIQE